MVERAGAIGDVTFSMLIALVLIALSYLFLSTCWGPLGSIPGPRWAALSRTWLAFHSRKGDMHRTMIRLHEKHGKLVRTGPREVSVSDPAAIKVIYGKQDMPISDH